MSMRNVTFVAVNRPGWFPNITRPSPELFGLIEATSNDGAGGACGASAPSRALFSALATTATARTAGAIGVRKLLPGCERTFEAFLIVRPRYRSQIIRPGAPPARPPKRPSSPGLRCPAVASPEAGGEVPPDLNRRT